MNRRKSRRIFPLHTKYQIKWTCKKSAFSLRKEGKRAFCRPRRDAVFSVSRRAKPFRKTRRRRRQSYFLSHVIIFSLTRSSVFSASPPAWRFFSRGKHLLSAISPCFPRDNRYWKKAYFHHMKKRRRLRILRRRKTKSGRQKQIRFCLPLFSVRCTILVHSSGIEPESAAPEATVLSVILRVYAYTGASARLPFYYNRLLQKRQRKSFTRIKNFTYDRNTGAFTARQRKCGR